MIVSFKYPPPSPETVWSKTSFPNVSEREMARQIIYWPTSVTERITDQQKTNIVHWTNEGRSLGDRLRSLNDKGWSQIFKWPTSVITVRHWTIASPCYWLKTIWKDPFNDSEWGRNMRPRGFRLANTAAPAKVNDGSGSPKCWSPVAENARRETSVADFSRSADYFQCSIYCTEQYTAD